MSQTLVTGALNGALHATGSIHLIFGPMFSGKSTELLRRMRRYAMAERRCMLIKYRNDTRYSLAGVVTHDKQTSKAEACTKLEELRELAQSYDVLGIDEGQFFPDIVPFCEDMANAGKLVIVAALDGTFQRKSFGDILELVPLAEGVVKLHAVCMICKQEAAFSKRIGSETEVEVIGGADKYIAVCRQCFHDPTPASRNKTGGDSGVGSPLTPDTSGASPRDRGQPLPFPVDDMEKE